MPRKLIIEVVVDAEAYARGLAKASKATSEFGHNAERAGRGIAVATLGIHGLGRQLTQLGASFAGGFAAAEAIKSIAEAGDEAIATQRQLIRQLNTSGVAFSDVKGKIDDATSSLSLLSGFNADELEQSFTTLERATGNVNEALRANQIAADVARGRHISLAQAAIALSKAESGNLTSLRRLGIEIPKGSSAMEALRIVAARYSGQAAAGATATDRFRAELHNTSAAIGEAVLPSLNRVLDRTARWLAGLNESGNKLKFVWDSIRSAAISAEKRVVAAWNAIDWAHVWAQGRRFSDGLVQAVRRVDWAAVGHEFSVGVTTAIRSLVAGIKAVNWQGVGKAFVDGIALALVALFKFLKGVDWKTVLKTVFRFFVAAVKLQVQVTVGAMKEAATLLMKAFGDQLISAGQFLERTAISIVLKIVEPFSHLPGFLGGGKFRNLKDFLQGELEALKAPAKASATAVGQAIGAGVVQGIRDYDPAIEAQMKASVGVGIEAANREAEAAAHTGGVPTGGGGRGGRTATQLAQQRNQWFDAMISRDITRAGYIPSLKGQIAALRTVVGLIRQRMSVTNDVTRLATLEDTRLAVQNTITGLEQQRAQNATANAQKIEAANKQRLDALAKAIKAGQAYTAGFAKLLAQRAQENAAARQRVQYRALGLTGAGDVRLPTPRVLLEQLRKLQADIVGTLQDTAANRKFLMGGIADLLGKSGTVTTATVQKIKDFYDTVHQALKDGSQGTLKYFKHYSAEAIVNSLGGNLSSAQRRNLELALSGIGPGFTAAAGSSAYGVKPVTVIHEMHLHGVQDMARFEDEIVRRQRARSMIRRGAR